MNLLINKIRLTLFIALTTVMAPAFSSDIDANLLEYAIVDPNEVAVAEAVIVNRSKIALPYTLEAISLQGDVLEVLTTGRVIAGETIKVSGKASGRNQYAVRIIVGDPNTGLGAEDVAYLSSHVIRTPPVN